MEIIAWFLGSQLGLPLLIGGGGLVVLGVVYYSGRAAGVRAQKAKRELERQKALKEWKELADEIDSLSDSKLDERISRWLRDQQS